MGKSRINCWELFDCGREPGGARADELGVCPVFDALGYDGVNDGDYAGRFCWAVAGTLCQGEVQGTFAEKAMDCMQCEFYAQVVQEQGLECIIVSPSQLS